MAGGKILNNGREVKIKDILIYDSHQNKWTKTGELCRGRAEHAMSLVPVESEIEDECIVDQDCFF